jgi:hypothetical protein
MVTSFLRRLVKEDFPQQYKELVGKIGYVINPAMEQISTALHNNLTFKDNIACKVASINITVDSSGIPTSPTTFQSGLPTPVQHILVSRAINASNSNSYVTSAPFIDFVDNSGTVSVKHVTGLPADTTFTLTLIATI